MLSLNLSESEIRVLNYERFRHRSPIVQKRLHVIYLRSLGYNNQQISECMDVHANSVINYVKLYQQGGIEALKELHYCGHESELMNYSDSIEKEFRKKPPLSSKEAAYKIELLTGIKRSSTQIKIFMKRIGMKFLKMGHIPAKADPQKQKAYLTKTLKPAIKEAKEGKCYLLFLDAAHFVHAPFLCQAWCFVRQFIQSPSGRQRFNVLGAINAINKKISFTANSTYIDAKVIGEFMIQLTREYTDLPIKIVLDNARYQHCSYVIDLARELKIELLFLPPYSPNLNIIERLWKYVKKKALYGQYYDCFENFQRAIVDVLQNSNSETKSKGEIDSLITLNFQTFENSQNLAA